MDYTGVIILLVGVVVVFLVCREIVCWYWKLNKIVYFQEYQTNLLKKILKELKKQSPGTERDMTTELLETAPGTTGTIKRPTE